ncbi:hypothetical protein [Agromyces sp. NPDC049794]|uniref:hypothetical protein n=1 Tax=unclassified Agromyces TaxID=2639701 RepID=UPI00340918D5
MSAPDPNDHGLLGERLKRAADAAAARPIDVDEVLRRSRAARRTRRTAVVSGVSAVAGVLAVTGLVLGLPGLLGPTATDGQVALESTESSGGAAEDAEDSRLVAPHEVNRCGAPVAPATDAATSPLVVTVEAPIAPVRPGSSNPVTVTVTNVGADTVTGGIDLDAPLTVADSGITVSHQGAVPDLPPLPIALAPGGSAELEGSFETRTCAAADDDAEAASTLAPALASGDYALSAVVTYTAPDGVIRYLISPLAPFTVG